MCPAHLGRGPRAVRGVIPGVAFDPWGPLLPCADNAALSQPAFPTSPTKSLLTIAPGDLRRKVDPMNRYKTFPFGVLCCATQGLSQQFNRGKLTWEPVREMTICDNRRQLLPLTGMGKKECEGPQQSCGHLGAVQWELEPERH